MDLLLKDKAFILTGATGGLGLASAAALVEEGARVLLTGRTQERLDEAVAGLGDRAIGVVADLADPESPERALDACREAFGCVDGLLVSVGGPPAASVAETTDEQWRIAFESVFLGAVRMAREIGAALVTGSTPGTEPGTRGSILFVVSTSSKAPLPGMAISNGLRPGLAMVAKTLADELGPDGVRVNSLMPGRIDTDRLQYLDGLADDPEAARAANEQLIPLRRYGRPEEFGRVAAFLLSPAAAFVSGATIPVDGGLLRTI